MIERLLRDIVRMVLVTVAEWVRGGPLDQSAGPGCLEDEFWHDGLDDAGDPCSYRYTSSMSSPACQKCAAGKCVQRIMVTPFGDNDSETHVVHDCADELS